MPIITITDEDTKICVSGMGYALKKSGHIYARIPQGIVDQFVIGNRVEITKEAFFRMSDTGIPVAILDSLGRLKTRLVPVWKHSAKARVCQSLCYADSNKCLGIAKKFVAAKLANSAFMLNSYAKNYTAPIIKITRDYILNRGDDIKKVDSLFELMGIEGICAKKYWDCFGTLLKCEFSTWTGRNRRPPKDPVNSVLSYSYSILTGFVMTYLELKGLDPYIGYLHTLEDRRPSLACDMIEPFRALYADKIVLKLFNKKQFSEADFVYDGHKDRGTFMSLEARKTLAKEIYSSINSCEEDLNMHSIQGCVIRDIEEFKRLAQRDMLEEFVPYAADPKNKIYKCLDLL